MFMSEKLLQNKEYMLDLCIRMAHHSTAIEGNTLTQDETASIILDNFITSPVKEREFYEVRNYKILLPYFIEKLQEKVKIDAELIKFFHSLIMKDLHEQAGKFKILQNAIIGADFETAKPYLVPVLLKELCDNLYFRLVIIPKDKKDFYISYLRKAKVDEDCINFIKNIQAQERERYMKFTQSESKTHKKRKKQ